MPGEELMFEKLIWQDQMSVGITRIDDQHKTIIAAINKLIDNEGALVTSEIITEVLTELKEYANEHFTLEESYMLKANYPDRENHIKGHVAYRETVDGFFSDVEGGVYNTPDNIFLFLVDWWTDHILNEDIMYSESMLAAGLG